MKHTNIIILSAVSALVTAAGIATAVVLRKKRKASKKATIPYEGWETL